MGPGMTANIPPASAGARVGSFLLLALIGGCATEPRVPSVRGVEMGDEPVAIVTSSPAGPVALEVRATGETTGYARSERAAGEHRLKLGRVSPGASVTLRALDAAGRAAGKLTAFRFDPSLIAEASAVRERDAVTVTLKSTRVAVVRLRLPAGKRTVELDLQTGDGLIHTVRLPDADLPVSPAAVALIAPSGHGVAQEVPLPARARRDLAGALVEWLAPRVARIAGELLTGPTSSGLLDRLTLVTDAADRADAPELTALDAKLSAIERDLPPFWLLEELRRTAGLHADLEVPLRVRTLLAAIDSDLERIATAQIARRRALTERNREHRPVERDALSNCSPEPHCEPGFQLPIATRGFDRRHPLVLFAQEEQLKDAVSTGRPGMQRTLTATGEVRIDDPSPLWEVELSGTFSMRATGAIRVTVNGHAAGTLRPPGRELAKTPLHLAIDPRCLVRGINTIGLEVRALPPALEERQRDRGMMVHPPGLVLRVRM